VVFEACTRAGWVLDLCQELGLPANVANTKAEDWKGKNVKRKADHNDAVKLARLTALGQPPEARVESDRAVSPAP
jgi:transposase